MVLLVAVGVLLLLTSIPAMESPNWVLALTAVLVLWWRRSAELALPRDLLRLLLFPLLLLCLSFHGIYTHPLAAVVKDCWYFTLPPVYLAFGYFAYERVGSWRWLMQPLVLVGCGTGLFAIVHALLNRGQLADAASVDAYRAVTGGGTFGPMVPMILILMARKAQLPEFGLPRWKAMRVTCYVASTGAVLITFSRTHMVALAMGLVCAVNFRTALRRLLRGGSVSMLVVLGLLTAGAVYLSQVKSGPVELFVKKTMNSGSEVQVRAFDTFEQINNNWRGYEAYRAAKTFETYSTAEKVFGGGAGAMVDLGFAMKLSPTEVFKYVPMTHNGYMYILMKDGILGIGLFALFILQLLRLSRRSLRLGDPEATVAGLVLLWTPLVMVATQGVITGIYNKGELTPILFLTGAAMASYSQRRRALAAAQYRSVWRGAAPRRPRLAAPVPEPAP